MLWCFSSGIGLPGWLQILTSQSRDRGPAPLSGLATSGENAGGKSLLLIAVAILLPSGGAEATPASGANILPSNILPSHTVMAEFQSDFPG